MLKTISCMTKALSHQVISSLYPVLKYKIQETQMLNSEGIPSFPNRKKPYPLLYKLQHLKTCKSDIPEH